MKYASNEIKSTLYDTFKGTEIYDTDIIGQLRNKNKEKYR